MSPTSILIGGAVKEFSGACFLGKSAGNDGISALQTAGEFVLVCSKNPVEAGILFAVVFGDGDHEGESFGDYWLLTKDVVVGSNDRDLHVCAIIGVTLFVCMTLRLTMLLKP